MYLNNLAILRRLAAQPSDLDELRRAVEIAAAAVASIDVHHVNRPLLLSTLATSLQSLADHTSDIDGFQQAVAAMAEAIAASPAGDPNRPLWLFKLASCLWSLFDRTTDLDLLRQAVDAARAAVAATPASNARRAIYLRQYAQYLTNLSVRTTDPAIGREAVLVARLALAAMPAGHVGRVNALFDLGAALMTLFEQTEEGLAREAVAVRRATVAAVAEFDLNPAGSLHALGTTLTAQARWTGSLSTLRAAAEAERAAIDALGENALNADRYRSGLASTLWTVFYREHDESVLPEAREHFKAVADSPVAPIGMRISAARALARIHTALGDYQSALDRMKRSRACCP